MAFKDLLIAAREKAGLNQSELARAIGVTPQAVQQWENGEALPRHNRWPALLATLNLSASYFLPAEDVAVILPAAESPADAPLPFSLADHRSVLRSINDRTAEAPRASSNEISRARRERIATAVLQGFAACSAVTSWHVDRLAQQAVEAASALIAELDKEPQS